MTERTSKEKKKTENLINEIEKIYHSDEQRNLSCVYMRLSPSTHPEV